MSSSSRPPLRTVSSPIIAISFPHIIDTIIEYASPQLLVSLRSTCRHYRRRITAQHIVRRLQAARSSSGEVGLHLHVEPKRAWLRTDDGTCPAPSYLAQHVRIVTLHAHTLQNTDFIPFKPLADTLAARGAALDVVRILDFEGASGKIPFKAPKYVLFMDADHQDYRERADGAWAPPPSPELGAGAELERLGAEAEGQPISPFPDTVTEIVCNIACNPTAGCTNLTCSQLSALDLGHRVLSNIIYIFRPVEEDEVPELESESETDAPEAESAAPESHQSAKLVPVTAPKDIDRLQTPRTPPLSRMSSRSSTASSSTSSSSPPSSPASTPALVPFIDNQLSFLPSPDFRIVGCENLRYTADPEMTLFARFASIMNCYADFELGLGLSHLDPPPGYEYLGFDMFAADDLSRAKYFKSYPQWAASCARSSDERAWYDLVTNQ